MIQKFYSPACLILVLLFGCLLSNCRKDNLVVISGQIIDPNQSGPVSGAKVEIWTQYIEDGIFMVNYVLDGTLLTGTDGKFLFNLKEKSYTGIRLVFSKEGYYGFESALDLEQVKNGNGYADEYFMLPQARLNISIRNIEPFNADDYFEFRILNGFSGCEFCCKSDRYQFYGQDVDQVIDCHTSGHLDLQIQWTRRKNGEQVTGTKSYFIKEFETNFIELHY